MRRSNSLFTRLCIAALVSGLAALLMVTVGPGFAEKPEDMGPNEHAAAQAQEASAEEDASQTDAAGTATVESAGVAASETGSEGSAAEAAANGNKPDAAPGQTRGEDSALVEGEVTATANGPDRTDISNGNGKYNEDTSQTGLPRGQSEDRCTNKHQGADTPQGGANQNPGPYDNTCDGRASENGSGGGNATGRPCMGCVGNADDKNPPGQLPNGKDHNAGYECDRNKGVGQGNPAHTDCQSTPTDCTGDMDPNNNEGCELIDVCRMRANGQWTIVTIRKDAQRSDDKPAPSSGQAKDCAEVIVDCTGDMDPNNNQGCELIDVCRMQANGHWKIAEIRSDQRLSTDLDAPASGKAQDCVPKKVTICHATGSATNPYVVITVSVNAWFDNDGHGHAGHPDDFEVPEGTQKADCGEDEVLSICYQLSSGEWRVAEDIDGDDVDTYTNARIVPKGTEAENCDEDVISICYQHSNGEWRVAEDIDSDDVGNYSNARIVPKGTKAKDCDEGDEYCPAGSDRAGMLNPSGNPADCDVDDKKVCPEGTELSGMPMPADKNCNPMAVVTVCPANSDRPMQVLPAGRTADWCDDEVQGEIIKRIPVPSAPKPNVQGKVIRQEPAGVLPFTGASVLAFLVLALQLIAAGSLILRGRRS